MVADFKTACSFLQYGQIYVALSRVRSVKNLNILNFAPKQIRPNLKTRNIVENKPKLEIQATPSLAQLSICCLNICSYNSPFEWLKNDNRFNLIDVHWFQEMRLRPNEQFPSKKGIHFTILHRSIYSGGKL